MWFVNILRIPNLLIVGFTLWVVSHWLIYPVFLKHNIDITLSNKEVYVLIFIALCASAGGYLHNDILDMETDTINDKRGFISTDFQKKLTYGIYFSIVLLPIPFAYSLASELGHIEYILLYIIVVALLYLYNTYLKRWPLVGNILIGALCSCVVLIMLLAESNGIASLKITSTSDYNLVMSTCLYYSGFAFLTNLNREIIKDAEDVEGDRQVGLHTYPVVFGIPSTKILLYIIHLLTFLLILMWWNRLGWYSFPSNIYLLILLALPAIGFWIYLYKSNTKDHFSNLSQLYKLWMICGIIFLMVYNH